MTEPQLRREQALTWTRSPRNRLGQAGFALLLVTATLTACGASDDGPAPSGARASAGFPVTIGSVRIPAAPRSIVSLSPTATEMLFAIGAGPAVVATDAYSDYPPEAPREDLDGIDLNVEAIIAFGPDLVVTQDPSPATDRLTSLGIPVLTEPAAATLEAAYEQIRQLGRATGHTRQAEELAGRTRTRIAEIVRRAPELAPATYFYELDPTLYSQTSGTFIGQILTMFNLTSIADPAGNENGSPQLSREYVLRADPDYIFLADTICCQQSAATVAGRPGWSALTAVENDRVIGIPDDIASRWGPRVVTLVQTVADELRAHPAATAS